MFIRSSRTCFDRRHYGMPLALLLACMGVSHVRAQSASADAVTAPAAQTGDASVGATYMSNAVAFKAKGSFVLAIAEYGKAIQVFPATSVTEKADAYLWRGWCQWRLGEMDLAVADYTSAAALTQNNPQIYQFRAAVYEDQKRFDDALADYAKMHALNPAETDTYVRRAAVLHKAGRDLEAREQFQKAVQLKPDDASLLFNLCEFYCDLKDWDAALVPAKRLVALKPQSAMNHFQLGIVYALQNNAPLAKSEFEQGLTTAKAAEKRIGASMVQYRLKSHSESEALQAALSQLKSSSNP